RHGFARLRFVLVTRGWRLVARRFQWQRRRRLVKTRKRRLDVFDRGRLAGGQQQRLEHFFQVKRHAGKIASSDGGATGTGNLNFLAGTVSGCPDSPSTPAARLSTLRASLAMSTAPDSTRKFSSI